MPSWTFLTNHALVLTHVCQHPESPGLEIAQAVGITERAARKIIADLQEAGYITAERVGRRNRYSVQLHRSLASVGEREVTVGEFIQLLWGRSEQAASSDGWASAAAL